VNGWPQKGQIIPSDEEPLASLRDPGRCDEKITVTIKGVIAIAKRLDCAATAFLFATVLPAPGPGLSGNKCDKSATIQKTRDPVPDR